MFSGGTSLMPLLKAGIRPDFHCELENSWSSVVHLRQVREAYGLQGITLLASATVHPQMPGLFDERIFYFRDSVASTPLWCPDGTGIHGTAPTCTNLALRAALVMAFREIYLFGVDLGTRHPDRAHSSGTIYQKDEGWKADEKVPLKQMNIPLPGNFGGEAWTNQILHWARMMMGQTIEMFSTAQIYNCCDGVAIPGTIPKLARTVQIKTPSALRAVALDRIRREMPLVEPGSMAPAARMLALRLSLAQYYAEWRGEITQGARRGC